jgi:serine protease Do
MASSSLTQFSGELSGTAAQAGNSVVAVFGRRRLPSSGTVWRNGVVVTANHAIECEEEISVLLPGGKRIPAKLAGGDPGTDLAALRVDTNELHLAIQRILSWLTLCSRWDARVRVISSQAAGS